MFTAGNRFLLDSNAIIALQRANENLQKILLEAHEVFVPSIAIGELYYGAYKSQRAEENRARLGVFIAQRAVLNVDVDTAHMYGKIKHILKAKGRPIPENDIWIAALAIQHHLILLTDDNHFDEVAGLDRQSW